MAKKQGRQYLNEGIKNVQEHGSRIVGAGMHMIPAASLMKASGVIKGVAQRRKPFVTVINSFSTHIPGISQRDDVPGEEFKSFFRGYLLTVVYFLIKVVVSVHIFHVK